MHMRMRKRKKMRERKKMQRQPTKQLRKIQRDFGTKALRRDGVQKSTPGGGTALT
jgi:hypothetical protein